MDKSQELAILLQKKQTYSPSFHTLRSFSLHSYEQMLEHISKILETSSTPQYIEEKEKYQKILDFVNTSVCFLFPCRIPCFLSFICFLIPLTIHILRNALHRSMKHQVFCFFFFFHSTHSRTSQSLYKSVEHRRWMRSPLCWGQYVLPRYFLNKLLPSIAIISSIDDFTDELHIIYLGYGPATLKPDQVRPLTAPLKDNDPIDPKDLQVFFMVIFMIVIDQCGVSCPFHWRWTPLWLYHQGYQGRYCHRPI